MKVSSETRFVAKTSVSAAVLTVLLLLLVNYFINGSWNLPLNTPVKSRTFQVQGTGNVTATPDQSDVSFTVTKTATTLQEAQNQANTSMNTILTDLQKVGVEKKDIQTSNYNSSPNYVQNNGGAVPAIIVNPQSQQIVSYTVSEDVDITIDNTEETSTIIDTITKDNAENISGPNVTFSEGKQERLEDQARTLAITNARQKAESMASAAGIRLGNIINIQEDNPTPVLIHPLMMSARAAVPNTPSVPTQINPGQNTITSNVTVTYETY